MKTLLRVLQKNSTDESVLDLSVRYNEREPFKDGQVLNIDQLQIAPRFFYFLSLPHCYISIHGKKNRVLAVFSALKMELFLKSTTGLNAT